MSDTCLLGGWTFCSWAHWFCRSKLKSTSVHHSCFQVPRAYKRWRHSNVWWTWRQCVCCGVVYRWPLGVCITVVRWTISDQQSSQSRKIQNPLIEKSGSNEHTKALCMKRAYHLDKVTCGSKSFLQDETVQLMRSWKRGFYPCQFEGSLLSVTCKIGTLEFLPYTVSDKM